VSASTIDDAAICRIVAGAVPRAAAKGGVTPSMSLQGDLGVDSVGLMSIVFLIEEQTGIDAFDYVQDFISAEYVSDIIAIVQQGLSAS
jgi:acyl carrier protein